MGILQGMHWVGIYSKEFPLHFKMQIRWPYEYNKEQLTPIYKSVHQTHVWSPTYAWVKLNEPFCDGTFDLGET
jgi:hypothetical protein